MTQGQAGCNWLRTLPRWAKPFTPVEWCPQVGSSAYPSFLAMTTGVDMAGAVALTCIPEDDH